MASDLELFLRVGIAGLAGLLFVISALSAVRVRATKVTLLAVAFGLFAARGAFIAWEGAVGPVGLSTTAWLGLDFAALVVLYVAVVR